MNVGHIILELLNVGHIILEFISSNVWHLSFFIVTLTFIYLNTQLYNHNRQRYYTIKNNVKIFDYDLLVHMLFQSIIFGGSSFVFMGLLVFGFTSKWPQGYVYQIGQGAIIFACFTFLIFSWKYVDEFIKIKISEKETIKISEKETITKNAKGVKK